MVYMKLSEEDKIIIKYLRQKFGYGAKRIIKDDPEKNWGLRNVGYLLNPLRDNVTRVLHEVFSKNLSSNLDIECFFFVDMKILPFLMKMSKFNELPY